MIWQLAEPGAELPLKAWLGERLDQLLERIEKGTKGRRKSVACDHSLQVVVMALLVAGWKRVESGLHRQQVSPSPGAFRHQIFKKLQDCLQGWRSGRGTGIAPVSQALPYVIIDYRSNRNLSSRFVSRLITLVIASPQHLLLYHYVPLFLFLGTHHARPTALLLFPTVAFFQCPAVSRPSQLLPLLRMAFAADGAF